MNSFRSTIAFLGELQCSSYKLNHSDKSFDLTAWIIFHRKQSSQISYKWLSTKSISYTTCFQLCICTSIQRRTEKTVTLPPAQRMLTHSLLPVQPMIQPQPEACTLETPTAVQGAENPEETVIQVDQPPLYRLLYLHLRQDWKSRSTGCGDWLQSVITVLHLKNKGACYSASRAEVRSL